MPMPPTATTVDTPISELEPSSAVLGVRSPRAGVGHAA